MIWIWLVLSSVMWCWSMAEGVLDQVPLGHNLMRSTVVFVTWPLWVIWLLFSIFER